MIVPTAALRFRGRENEELARWRTAPHEGGAEKIGTTGAGGPPPAPAFSRASAYPSFLWQVRQSSLPSLLFRRKVLVFDRCGSWQEPHWTLPA